ncbi:MAG: phosphoribosyltransferase [Mycobacterium sp.]
MGETAAGFRNRREAGRALAGALSHLAGDRSILVLGLARGGVPVGWEVAVALAAPFDVFLVRKLGVPHWPELAMGALATGGAVVRNEDVIRSQDVTEDQVRAIIERESVELVRRQVAYRGNRQAPELTGHTVVLVDDGIATGASMMAAIRAVRAVGAARVVVAVPVGSPTACHGIGRAADELVCLHTPPDFGAVGAAYADFTQTTDEEVCALLAARR